MHAGTHKKCTGIVYAVWRIEMWGQDHQVKAFQRLTFGNIKVSPAFPMRLTAQCASSRRRITLTSSE